MTTQTTRTPDMPAHTFPPTALDGRMRRRLLALGAFAAAGSVALSGCDVATDTPLHVTEVARAVTPGEDIVGKVGYPDGKITVSLVPEASPVVEGHRTRGETPCTYKRFRHTFACATTGLPQGLYLVQVTDAGQPGEGTAQAQVAVSDVSGYDPQLLVGDGTEKAKAGPTRLKLTGWRPGVSVKITLVDDNNKVVFARSATPGSNGATTLRTTSLRPGHYGIAATDGLWKISGFEGSYNDAYSGLEVS